MKQSCLHEEKSRDTFFLVPSRSHGEQKARPKPWLSLVLVFRCVSVVKALSLALHPGTPATFATSTDAAVSAAPWPRFAGCAPALPQTTGPLLPACVPSRLPRR